MFVFFLSCGSPGFLASVRVKLFFSGFFPVNLFLRVIVGFMDEWLVFLFMVNFAEVVCVVQLQSRLGHLSAIKAEFNTLPYRNHILRPKTHVPTTKPEQESQGNGKLPRIKLRAPKKRDKLVVLQHDPSNRRGKS